MDPLADKLLIIAALISLVSLHRLAAWVAMVIITRELVVTVLRLGATQAGVIIAASMFGKVKTCLQIAAILAVIAVPGHPVWVSALLDLAVLVTVLSGLDYCFGLRRRLQQAPASTPAPGERPRWAPEPHANARSHRQRPVEPLLERRLVGGRRALLDLRAQLQSRPWRSATTLC